MNLFKSIAAFTSAEESAKGKIVKLEKLSEMDDELLPKYDMPELLNGAAVGKYAEKGDAALRQIANRMMDDEKQDRLESLIAQSKLRALTANERIALDDLMLEAQHLMLRKAEAYRLLARRGHIVFPP